MDILGTIESLVDNIVSFIEDKWLICIIAVVIIIIAVILKVVGLW